MHPLDIKLLRDLGTMKGQVVAVALVMACGLAVLIMARSLVVSLEVTEDAYYRNHRFAQVFAELKRAPNSLGARIREIPGVAAVETRVRGPLTLDIPGMQEPAEGLIYSLPEDRPQTLNQLYVRQGRLPEAGVKNEVVISEGFATAHGFTPGNTIEATIYGAQQRLHIVGIVLSPEFVYEVNPGKTIPDHKRFGVFWMRERQLATALDLDGAFNNVVMSLAPDANPRDVMARLDILLAPYGGRISYDRTEHPSAQVIDDRIEVLKGFAIAFPVLFLSIAAFMSSAALTRLIRLQREQIAQLKALGYGAIEIGSHYMKFALVMVCLGTMIGVSLGLWMGYEVTVIYRRFFYFPELPFMPDWLGMTMGCLAAVMTCAIGVSGAVWQAIKLPPAEAMRPEPPAEFRHSLLEHMGLHRLVSPQSRMALRNLQRKPWQSFFTLVGLALATAIPIVPGSVRDSIDYLMDFQWGQAQRQDVTVSLIEPGPASTYSALHSMPGVMTAEVFRVVPALLSHGHLQRRVGVTGLPAETKLSRVLDADGEPIEMPLDGLLISAKLAEILEVVPGDIVRLEIQEGRRPVLETVVSGTITDFTGIGVYMQIGNLYRLMREEGMVSGAHMKVDTLYWNDFLASVKDSPRIGSILITENVITNFHETTGDMMYIVQGIYLIFAIIVAVGVVYNGARIALSERSRDLATLRVIGFQPREVASVLIGELLILTVLALPIGLLLGNYFANVMIEVSSTETVRLPLVVSARTYATAVLVILISSLLSFAVVSKRIHKLNMLSVLSARD